MRYVKQKKIYTIEEIRQLFPNMSIPADADCSSLGFEFLEEVAAPVKEGFYVVEVAPVNNKQTWELRAIEIDVPTKISRLQAKLQLLEIGLLDEVEDLVAQDRKVQLYWKEADNFYRTDSILLGMATALNLDGQQLDELFIEASKL